MLEKFLLVLFGFVLGVILTWLFHATVIEEAAEAIARAKDEIHKAADCVEGHIKESLHELADKL